MESRPLTVRTNKQSGARTSSLAAAVCTFIWDGQREIPYRAGLAREMAVFLAVQEGTLPLAAPAERGTGCQAAAASLSRRWTSSMKNRGAVAPR